MSQDKRPGLRYSSAPKFPEWLPDRFVPNREDKSCMAANSGWFVIKGWFFGMLIAGLAAGSTLWATPNGNGVRGSVNIHDPSTIIKCKGRYYIYGTGPGIRSKSSADGVLWTDGPAVFASAPAWVLGAAPGFNGDFWAPDIAYFNGRYNIYYSVSSWGSQQSAIGLATSPTLDPADPAYQWTDQGIVIQSTNGSPFNTIDPNVTTDANGNPWLVYGSYWNGIYIVQLDAATGLRNATNTTATRLAYNGSIEASCIYRRGGYYYLFVNWGSCCDGVNSTYNVRVGRSTSITGPYLDRNGVDLRSNGGTVFAEASGKFVGPGHIGVLEENGQRWFSYHYYDAGSYSSSYGAFGTASFDIQPLTFTADDWPVLVRDWSAHYNFDADARDENGQYYGMLYGATLQTDASRGRVLNLNGAGQYARLPAGVANARTFTAVVKWNGGANWQRIFDFGTDTSNYIMLTPSSSDGRLRCDIRVSGTTQTIEWASKLPIGVWTPVAVTLDGTRAVLYVNGLPVVTNTAVTFSPYQTRAQTNLLGRSKFVADPDFNGQIGSFHVYARVLSAYEIAAPIPVIGTPAEGATYWPGMTLNFSGAAADFTDLPLAANQLTWRLERLLDGVTNVVGGPTTGVTNSSFVIPTNAVVGATYRIVLAATNSSGRGAVVYRSLTPVNPPPAWSVYYPFQADASDANGHFNGTLQGGATFQTDATRGDVLNLSGVNQYVSLPSDAGDILTFMAWVKWNGGAAWQRILDFGNDTTRYFVLTPSAANGKLRCNLSVSGIAGEQILDAPGPLPVGVWTHVAVVLDGTRGVLYTNGVPVATNAAMNLVPADLNATNIWFGRSQFPDPYFNGQLSSVRMFSRSLSAEEIVAPTVTIGQPAQGSIYRPGEVISFNGNARDFYDSGLVATSLVWSVQWRSNTTVTTIINNLSGVTNGSFTVPTSGIFIGGGAYRIQLVATDAVARKATNYVDIFPAASVVTPDWASYYPFSSTANDASNRFNGTFAGGTTIALDATRGAVANLSGASQYVNLPAGAGVANTVSGWVKWNGGNAWQRIFDFGVDTTHWFYLTPKDSSGRFQCAITANGSSYSRVIQGLTEFPTNEWVHVAVVFDGKQGVLYTNGQPAAVNNSVNLLPSDVAATKVYLGRSQYSADPYFNGRLDAFRLNSRALSLADLAGPAATILTPLPSLRYAGGSTIAFSGRVLDYAETPLAATTFNWAVDYQHDGVTDSVLAGLSGVTNGTFTVPTNAPNTTNAFYRVRLTATDTNGLQNSATVDVSPLLVQLALASVPSGLAVQFESQAFTTPTNVVTVAGMTRILNAPSPQNVSGSNYNFIVWSDGGTQSHGVTVPTINSSITASFVTPEVTLTPAGTDLVISWPDWANSLKLAAATNLASPVIWQPVTNVPLRSGNIYWVELPMSETQQFFRLQSP